MKSFNAFITGLIALAALSGLSSCTTYQYAFIQTSDQDIVQNIDRDFVKEDDKTIVSYCFFGENLPVQISVENKMSRPVFVDWSESALIVEDAALSYVNRNLITTGLMNSTTYHYSDYLSFSDGEFISQTLLPEATTFIPPHSRIVSTPLYLDKLYLDKIPDEFFQKESINVGLEKSADIEAADFTAADSPLRFKSYLTFYTKNEKGEREYSWSNEQSFYISEIVRGKKVKPGDMYAYREKHGDFFYTYKANANAAWITVGGLAALSTIVVFVSASSGPDMPSGW